MNVLISIKKPWSDKILTREKEFELRKNHPKWSPEKEDCTVYMYESGKDGAHLIVGKFHLFSVHDIDCYFVLKGHLVEKSCVSRAQLEAYLPCRAWRVTRSRSLKYPVSLSDIGIHYPPVSWRYITQDQADIIERRVYDLPEL